MNNPRLLKIALFILVLINLSTLAFLWLHRPPHGPGGPRRGGPGGDDFINHELRLSESQRDSFDASRSKHHQAMVPLQERSHQFRTDLFKLVRVENATDSVKVNTLSDSIAALQKQMEKLTFYHVVELRKICTPKQKPRFDEIIGDAMQQMMGGGNPPPPPR